MTVSFSNKQLADILDRLDQKFLSELGDQWQATVAKNSDGSLAEHVDIKTSDSKYKLDCSTDKCKLTEIIRLEPPAPRGGFPLLVGCIEIPPDSAFADYRYDIGEIPTFNELGKVQGQDSTDICEPPESKCLADVNDASTGEGVQPEETSVLDAVAQPDVLAQNDVVDVQQDAQSELQTEVGDTTSAPDTTTGACIEWEKQYPISVSGDLSLFCEDTYVKQISNGEYVIAGTLVVNTGPKYIGFAFQTDLFGNKIWDKIYDSGSITFTNFIKQTSDGGFISGGSDYTPSNSIGLLRRTDTAGNQIWEKTYKKSSYLKSAQQTIDGGFALFGFSSKEPMGSKLIKTDSEGNEQWNQIYDYTKYKFNLVSGQQTTDDGYVLFGNNDDAKHPSLIKTNVLGQQQWNMLYNSGAQSNQETGTDFKQTLDGGFILAGHTYTIPPIIENARFLIKTNQNGNEEWKKIFFKKDKWVSITFVDQSIDGGYLIGGRESSGATKGLFSLTKTDSNSNILWENTDIWGVMIYSGGFTADNGIILAGEKDGSAWLKKICPSN